ncbi:dihydropteroate synthase [Shewanella psychrotolerans]|uniref:dihydropteroate synthase n=1 Tax=Shewanella psychrotolerans TaxID=2864206 RepID=UPI001C66092E|nr:dihydropteroate synthase [Shewanella psychrotolerans]QYK03337.1 dihydropteroate synthase [Shewanella psychrotolerans]
MGILNVTPDSFSDGGHHNSFERACRHADLMVSQGASFIDIGGESTRPGAAGVTLEQELERVIPLVEYVSANHDVWISIDTSKAQVMQEAVESGAHLINDVRALQEPDALSVAAKLNVPVCLMHMQGQPRTMQQSPVYGDIVEDIVQFFNMRINACEAQGIDRSQILLDPGFGFGKTLAHNYELLNRLAEFNRFELPLLIGLSRKSMIGQLLQADVDERLAGSLAAAMLSVQKGAHILRVHDVKETVDMIEVMHATTHFKTL